VKGGLGMPAKEELDELREKMDEYLRRKTPLGVNEKLLNYFFNLREHWIKQLTQEPYRTPTPRRLYYMVDHGWLHSEWLYVNLPAWVALYESKVSSQLYLNDAEWFVLASSAYLHDCGMIMPDYLADVFIKAIDQYPNWAGDKYYLFTDSANAIAQNAKQRGDFTDKEFRKMHPDLGAWWVASMHNEPLIPYPELESMSKLIAKTVSLHSREAADERKNFLDQSVSIANYSFTVRVGLLAAIVAVVDGSLVGRDWVDDLNDITRKDKFRNDKIRRMEKYYADLASLSGIESPVCLQEEVEKYKDNEPSVLGVEKRKRLTLLGNQQEVWDKLELLKKQREHYLKHLVIRKVRLHENRLILIPNYQDAGISYDFFSEKPISFENYTQTPGKLIADVISDIKEEVAAANDIVEFMLKNNNQGLACSEQAVFPKEIFIAKNKQEADHYLEQVDSCCLFNADSKKQRLGNKIQKKDFNFQFARYGTDAPPKLDYSNILYLDVGQDLRVGVLDHHQFDTFHASAARLVVRYPHYVRQAVNPYNDDNLTFVVHRRPDLDAVAAAALALEVLEKEPDYAALRLAEYVNLVDSGSQGISRNNIFSLYSAFAQIMHNIMEEWGIDPLADDHDSENESKRLEGWNAAMESGIKLVQYVLEKHRKDQEPIDKIDAFKCPHCLSKRDRKFVIQDLERYKKKLEDPYCKKRIMPLQLPQVVGGLKTVKALIIRNVQGPDIPDRVLFFKDWARSDVDNNAQEEGFNCTCVIEEEAIGDKAECWIAVKPNTGINLRGLGQQLEEFEVKKRLEMEDSDSRWLELETGVTLLARKGFDNPDPWYDGRGHNYTIVQTPNEGTVLDSDEVEAILSNYGSGAQTTLDSQEVLNLRDLMSYKPIDTSIQQSINMQANLQKLDYIYYHYSSEGEKRDIRSRPIFISVSDQQRGWAKQNIYGPIEKMAGPDMIFFGLERTQKGEKALNRLGIEIQHAKVFIYLLSKEYLDSPLCKWEIEKAYAHHTAHNNPYIISILYNDHCVPHNMLTTVDINPMREKWLEDLLALVSMKCEL